MCLSCRVPIAVWREAAGQLRGPISLPEREKCRFSSSCQEGQGAIWKRELQGLAGTAQCHEGPPQPLHQGRMEIMQALGGYLKREYTLSQLFPIRQMVFIPLFPMRPVKKDPLIDSSVLFAALGTTGGLQRRGQGHWPWQNEQPLIYTRLGQDVSQLQTTGTRSSADAR